MATPALDADVIYLNYQILQALGITRIKVLINTIGGATARQEYATALRAHFSPHLALLCGDCQQRYIKNPLRMLDCKVDYDLPVMKTAPKISDFLQADDLNYYNEVLSVLNALNVPYETRDNLVRGLDYYTQTVFEIIYDDVNSPLANIALSAGGRYNNLIKEFGGPLLPAIGFAMGVERLMMVMDELGLKVVDETTVKLTILTIGIAQKLEGLRLANFLRNHGLTVSIDYEHHNLKPQFKLAEKTGADYLLLLGEEEIEHNIIKVKTAATGQEEAISIGALLDFFKIEGEQYAYKK